jgi:hypothetical protein
MVGAQSYERIVGSVRAEFGRITREDVRCASALVLILLAYGTLMAAISGVQLSELAIHLGNFAALSFYSGMLVATAYAVACLLRPAVRQDLQARIFWLAVACLLTTLTFPFFAMFKELVLPMRGFLWDRTFAHLGRALFGVSPWTLTHDLFGSVLGTRLLDLAYRCSLPFIFGIPLVSAVVFRDPRLRLRLVSTWMTSWIAIGTLAGWYFASAGPCYYNNFVASDPDYANLLQRLAAIGAQASAQGHPIASLQYQSGLLLTFRTHDFAPGGGISAMPSMHVAMATLLSILGFRINRWLGAAFTTIGILVWFATVHFGWHYFVDGPVGALMMLALWKLSGPVAAFAYRNRPARDCSTRPSDPLIVAEG